MEIIDLSQEIFDGMPVYKSLPQVKITVSNTHEEWEGNPNAKIQTPSVYKLEMGEHTGTHVDAINHMDKQYAEESIDVMPLSTFYTEGICLDFRNKGLQDLITVSEIEEQLKQTKQEIKQGDTVLFCTEHYKKHFQTPNWSKGPGITTEVATWLGRKKIAAFGVETMSPGVPGISNSEVHKICGKYKFTHYENMVNLDALLGKGRFRFIGLPLKIKGGTGSPVRAVAIFE